jgi:hypothetical protein
VGERASREKRRPELRERINSDSICGAIVFLLTLAFWIERSYANPLAGYFPDFVLTLLALMSVVLIGRGILKPPGDGTAEFPRFSRLAVAVALLAVWVFLLSFLGFLAGGVVMFLAVSLYMRGSPIEIKGVLLDVVVSVALVVIVHAVFMRILNVPLPPGPF